MNKIEQAKEKLFKNMPCHSKIHNNSIHDNQKDLKFHSGDDQFYYIESKGLKEISDEYMMSEKYRMPETEEECFQADYDRGEVLFKADIAIFHKEYVKYIIEVVDKFYIDYGKIDMINKFFDGICYYQVKADDILKSKNMLEEDIEFLELLVEF